MVLLRKLCDQRTLINIFTQMVSGDPGHTASVHAPGQFWSKSDDVCRVLLVKRVANCEKERKKERKKIKKE